MSAAANLIEQKQSQISIATMEIDSPIILNTIVCCEHQNPIKT
jgi:hypothetical protein